MKDKIEIDDIVKVEMNNAQITLSKEARVLHVPSATGDSWVFKDLYDDRLIYVSEGCTVIFLRKL